jgi:membrane protease YdiL (CAAX protease family)
LKVERLAGEMDNKGKYSTSQLFNFVQDSYLERTSRPIYAVVFLLPFIVFYELGTIFINTDVLNQSQVRVVAFIWLQDMLEYLGFGSKFAWAAPALAVVVILISQQLVSRKRWRLAFGDIWPMSIECVLLAVPLIVLSLFLNTSGQQQTSSEEFVKSTVQSHYALSANEHAESAVQSAPYGKTMVYCRSVANYGSEEEATASDNILKRKSLLADIVTSIGAGIYEELVFRLILMSVLMILLQNTLGFERKTSVIVSVLLSAGLFSAHHHISAPVNWVEFGFRTAAGVYFAALFAIRGFGVTAGTHAFYDIIATGINAAFFQQ